MKKLLFILTVISASVVCHVQAQTKRWWSAYQDGMPTEFMGTTQAETYLCAAQFSNARAILSGATLHGVRFYLRDKSVVSDVKVWLSTQRPTTVEGADIAVVDVPQAQLVDLAADQQMLEVQLPQAYTFTSATVYVGYAFKVSSASKAAGKQPVVSAGKNKGTATGNFWLRTSKTLPSWNNMATNYGALAMQLLVSNGSLPVQAVQVDGFERQVALGGTTLQADLSLSSTGLLPVSNFDYIVSVNGQAQPEQHCQLDAPLWATGSAGVAKAAVGVPAASGIYGCSLQVTKVNGAAVQPSVANTQLVAATQLAHRRSVVEEYTGTWCTNCPRGFVGMANMAAAFADDFIGIAVHTNNGSTTDPMYLAAYRTLSPSGVPRCQMDRKLWCDPYQGLATDYHYHAGEALQLMLDQPAEADLSVSATWADEGHTKLQLTATSTFYINTEKADYAVAFVLTEDSLTGTTKEWWQVNGDSGSHTFPDADMDFFRNAADPVHDMVYNHVAVAAEGVVNGIAGSVPATLTAARPVSYSATLDLGANTIIQDKSRLQANALLLCTTNGQIVNAAKCRVGQSSAVSSVAEPARQTGRYYTLDGRPVAAPAAKGIYIRNGNKIIFN